MGAIQNHIFRVNLPNKPSRSDVLDDREVQQECVNSLSIHLPQAAMYAEHHTQREPGVALEKTRMQAFGEHAQERPPEKQRYHQNTTKLRYQLCCDTAEETGARRSTNRSFLKSNNWRV